jgi:mono/diheme cytochrome c family protein
MCNDRRGGWMMTAVVLVAAVATGAPQAWAEDMAVTQGQKLYTKYCASCHGATGTGDGPVGKMLNPPASDLTTIAKQNGGKFPFYEVMQIINGRSPESQQTDASLPGVPKAHGSAAMPVWGEVFSRDELSKGSSLDLQLQATGKIMLITEYLQSIQQK